ncbi:MAG: hypothetical protein WCA49_09980 [Candidatus Sulfotelmatobacter sp.]
MRAVFVVVAHILGHQPLQMPLIQDDYAVQQVASATPHPALSNPVLPRTAKGSSHGRASHRPHRGQAKIGQARIDQTRIGQAQTAAKASVVVPRSGDRWQPLCAVYRRDFADAAEAALRAGRNRIDLLFAVAQTRVIEEDEMERAGFSRNLFRNLNTPEELEPEPRA